MDDSEHKVDYSDYGRVLDSELIGAEESDIGSESDGKTAMLTVEMIAFLSFFFLPYPNFAPLSPNITCARGSHSFKITWYDKGS